MVPSNLSPPGSTPEIEEPPSLREMGRSPRRRIYGTQKWRTGLHGYTAKTDPGGVFHARLHSPTKWIQLLHKHPAHLHALDIKDAQPQRDPGIKPLAGMTMSKLTDKYTIKRNKIRNQITLLRGQAEDVSESDRDTGMCDCSSLKSIMQTLDLI